MSDILSSLLAGRPVPLASWFAEPVDAREAQAWLLRIRQRLGTSAQASRFGLQLAALIAHYWTGREVGAEFATLFATPLEPVERAMLQLCYGQLLLSRKCRGAWAFLDAGFEQAAHFLEADEYFQVLRRHDILRRLPLAPRPSVPEGLQALLTEGEIIRQLEGEGTRRLPTGQKHRDTVG